MLCTFAEQMFGIALRRSPDICASFANCAFSLVYMFCWCVSLICLSVICVRVHLRWWCGIITPSIFPFLVLLQVPHSPAGSCPPTLQRPALLYLHQASVTRPPCNISLLPHNSSWNLNLHVQLQFQWVCVSSWIYSLRRLFAFMYCCFQNVDSVVGAQERCRQDLIPLCEDWKQVCSSPAPVCVGKPEHMLAGLCGSTYPHTCGHVFPTLWGHSCVLAGLEGHLRLVGLCLRHDE